MEQLKQLLERPRRIVITSHANPDGDALGSALGLHHYLKAKGHEVVTIMPTDMPDFLDWMPGYGNICVYPRQFAATAQYIRNAEILFALDYNDWARLETMAKLAEESSAYKVLIDHHLLPKIEAGYTLWRTSASSTSELIYEFIELLGDLDAMPLASMESMFVGIITDTGRFSYSTNPRVYRVAADLVERGVEDRRINDLITNSFTLKRFQLMGFGLSQRVEWLEDINAAILAFTLDDHANYQIQRGDTEGFVNMLLQVRPIRCAIMLAEHKDIVKISMRSKGSFSVQKICMEHFNGGGHLNASGASSKASLADTIAKLKEILYSEPYRTLLTS